MCFYLNKKHQENPPTPVDEDVKIEKNEEMTVYVHTFGGYAMQDNVWIREAQAFAKILKKNIDSIDFSDFITAGYDSPSPVFGFSSLPWLATCVLGKTTIPSSTTLPPSPSLSFT